MWNRVKKTKEGQKNRFGKKCEKEQAKLQKQTRKGGIATWGWGSAGNTPRDCNKTEGSLGSGKVQEVSSQSQEILYINLRHGGGDR